MSGLDTEESRPIAQPKRKRSLSFDVAFPSRPAPGPSHSRLSPSRSLQATQEYLSPLDCQAEWVLGHAMPSSEAQKVLRGVFGTHSPAQCPLCLASWRPPPAFHTPPPTDRHIVWNGHGLLNRPGSAMCPSTRAQDISSAALRRDWSAISRASDSTEASIPLADASSDDTDRATASLARPARPRTTRPRPAAVPKIMTVDKSNWVVPDRLVKIKGKPPIWAEVQPIPSRH